MDEGGFPVRQILVFLLELGQHGPDGDNPDPADPPAFDQLGEQDAALNCIFEYSRDTS